MSSKLVKKSRIQATCTAKIDREKNQEFRVRKHEFPFIFTILCLWLEVTLHAAN
uniref:Uncharacterized protein n=1 Tax=Rhizophora mucronata TaxID=61149 RepID=A0A2P2J250_RHIMU